MTNFWIGFGVGILFAMFLVIVFAAVYTAGQEDIKKGLK